jgi:phage baseplate assembly protein W
MTEWYGINYPFKGGSQNVLTRQIGIRIIKNDILQLIYTNPGERVYRPSYGIGIRRFVFDQLDSQTINSLKENIITQIGLFEKRVSIESLDINEKRDKNTIEILLVCSLIQQPDEIFSIDLSLPILSEEI